jgi:hypothetical protein
MKRDKPQNRGSAFYVSLHRHAMKMSIILLLSCMPLFAADTDIQITTTSQTNAEKNLVMTQEVFTRAGQTNLVRRTMYKAGSLEVRQQQIYHGGVRLAAITTGPSIFFIKTADGFPYSVSFDYLASNDFRMVGIWTTNETLVDAFNYKDGILSPVESSLIQNPEMRSNTTLEPNHP